MKAPPILYICDCKLALEKPGWCARCGSHAIAYAKVGQSLVIRHRPPTQT